jgi:hypothetical protein
MSLGKYILFNYFQFYSVIDHSFISLEVNDGYDIYAAQKSSTASSTRYWPVDRKSRYRNDNPYRQRVRPARGGGGVKQRGGDYYPRSAQIRLGKLIIY